MTTLLCSASGISVTRCALVNPRQPCWALQNDIAATEINFPVPQKIFPVIGSREFHGNGCGSAAFSVWNRVGKFEITISLLFSLIVGNFVAETGSHTTAPAYHPVRCFSDFQRLMRKAPLLAGPVLLSYMSYPQQHVQPFVIEQGRADVRRRRDGRTHCLPSDSGRTAPSICLDLMCDRYKLAKADPALD